MKKPKPAVMKAYRLPRDVIEKINKKAGKRGNKTAVVIAALRKGLA